MLSKSITQVGAHITGVLSYATSGFRPMEQRVSKPLEFWEMSTKHRGILLTKSVVGAGDYLLYLQQSALRFAITCY